MTTSRAGWTTVSQVADVLQITATVAGVVTVVLAAFGKNPFAHPGSSTLVVALVSFAVVGLVSIGTAFARNRRSNAGFDQSGVANSGLLYAVGLMLLMFALGIGLLLLLRPDLSAAANCPAP